MRRRIFQIFQSVSILAPWSTWGSESLSRTSASSSAAPALQVGGAALEFIHCSWKCLSFMQPASLGVWVACAQEDSEQDNSRTCFFFRRCLYRMGNIQQHGLETWRDQYPEAARRQLGHRWIANNFGMSIALPRPSGTYGLFSRDKELDRFC